MPLTGKVAVVVGGSSGIGAASVRALAAQGATVAIGYHEGRERAAVLLESLPPAGHSCVQLSLTDAQSIRTAANEVETRHGRMDILVNSAGATRPVPHADLEALDDELFDRLLRSNVGGPFATIRAFAPLLRRSGDGVIVNISSISAFTGQGSNIAYCSSKAALDTMTLALARALAPEIRVLCVSPGAVATGFVAGRDRDALERLAAATPLRRVVEPEDVAHAVMACITHLTASTGIRIVVDGGSTLL
jgi:3-oxoacyl-[acyl-carrier protein] reductase